LHDHSIIYLNSSLSSGRVPEKIICSLIKKQFLLSLVLLFTVQKQFFHSFHGCPAFSAGLFSCNIAVMQSGSLLPAACPAV